MADPSNPSSALPPGGAAPGAAPAQASQGNVPPLVVKAQYIKDLSFENPRAPASLQPMQGQPAVQISVNVGAQRLSDSDYEVVLTINAEAKTGAEALFVAELTYGGVVGIGNIAAEHVRPLLLIEAPRLLFPFARNIIADATRDGGFPPLLIQPVDFVELYRRELAQQGRSAQA